MGNVTITAALGWLGGIGGMGVNHPRPLQAIFAVGGGGSVGSLGDRIGEHFYYCWGKGMCSVGSGFLGSEVNVDTVVLTVIVMAFILLLALFARSRLTLDRPRGLQNVLEMTFDFVNGFVVDTLGSARARAIGPLAVALFLFILVANWIDLLPVPRVGAPTSDLNTTAGLAIMVFILSQTLGVRRHGPIGYVKHLFAFPVLAPITVIEEISKPITLSLRLFGNIFAGEVLIIVFGVLLTQLATAITLPLPYVLSLVLGLFVGAIQAFVFAVLTVSYIGIATSSEH